MVAYLFSETPVWLKSRRHVLSFAIAFGVTHFWPYNLFSGWVNRHALLFKTALYGACALYKLRKVAFCMVHPAIDEAQWYLKVVVALVDLEMSSTMRKFTGWWWRGCVLRKTAAWFDPARAGRNLRWCLRQYGPGLVAILLVGIGQRCWLCHGRTFHDLMGYSWSPLPAKPKTIVNPFDPVPEPFRPPPSPAWLDAVTAGWGWAIENLMHPLAIAALLYRYWRQISFSSAQRPGYNPINYFSERKEKLN